MVTLLMVAGTPAAAQDGHDGHGISVPINIGPLGLRVALLYAVPAVAGFAVLRGFLPAPSKRTAAFVSASAALAVTVEFMLADSLDIPRQVAVLAMALVALPTYLTAARSPAAAPAFRLAQRCAPWVIAPAAVFAAVEFARVWLGDWAPADQAMLLHSGVIIGLAGLSWLTLGVPRGRVARIAVQTIAGVAATALLGAAAQATVLGGL
ncbi:DUF6239 family natural product biosynthesis protein [Actinokineospora sp.]|uniref:DUF6239 family natural product biosynthesis protein n=1 Tax=Actinokineospora sp. TaxID=1872133 RepID=UPI004037B035